MSNTIVQSSENITTITKGKSRIELPLITANTIKEQTSSPLNTQQSFSQPKIELTLHPTVIESQKNNVTIQTGKPAVTINISGSIAMGYGDPNPYAFIPAGESIPAFRVCHVVGGKAYLSSASMSPSLGLSIKGMSVSNAVVDGLVQIQLGLIVQNPAWNLSTGTPVFLGENGQITQQIPTDGLSVEIGTALSDSKLFLDVEEPISL